MFRRHKNTEFYSSPYYFFLRDKGDKYSLYFSVEGTLTEARKKDEVIHFKKEISIDSLESLTLGHIWSPGFDPELGTLNEILSTGKMNIIKSIPLRKHISTWNKYMDELMEVDDKLAHFDLQVKTPLYSKQIPFKNGMSTIMNNGNKTGYQSPKSNFEWNSKALLESKEFENMLSNYMIYSKLQQIRLLDIKQNINEMIALIN